MRTFNNGFRDSLRGIRDIYAIVSYESPEGSNILITENNAHILTEDLKKLGTEYGAYEIMEDAIYSTNIFVNTSFFKTICMGMELECKFIIPEGTEIDVQIGTTNELNGDIEYIDMGYFIINGKPEYKADTDTYTMVALDHMLDSMISFKDNPLGITYPIKHKDFLKAIFDKFGWQYVLDSYTNEDYMVDDLYSDTDMTYREVLDDLIVATGKSLMFNTHKILKLKGIYDTQETVTDEDMDSTNVTFGDIYGRINKLVSTTDDITYTIGEDTQSIQEYGKTEYDIGKNLLIAQDTEGTLYDAIFSEIDNVYFHTYDVDTKGLLIFEPLDKFKFVHNEVEYPVILLNDEIKCCRGLTETVYTEEPEETVETYTSNEPTQKDIKNAVVNVNRLNAELVLKVDSDGKIAQVKLNGDADEGTEVSIQADNIDFTSHTFDLDTDDISIESDNVTIDNNGIQLRNGAVICGENGMLTNLVFNSNGFYNGLGICGFVFDSDGTSRQFQNTPIVVDVYIPSNYVIKEAYAQITHVRGHFGSDGNTIGYVRNVHLYKNNNQTAPTIYSDSYSVSGFMKYNQLYGTEVTGAFGTNGYTATNTTSDTYEFTQSSDIKNALELGKVNTMYIQTTDSMPSTETECNQHTGFVQLTINVICYIPYTR